MNDLGAFARNIASGERASFEDAFEDLFHAESESVRLGSAFNFRFAESGAQDRRQLASSVDPLVVHLDDDDAFEYGEDFLEAIWKRMDVTQMKRAGFLAVLAGKLHRVVDRPVSGTPADEQSAF